MGGEHVVGDVVAVDIEPEILTLDAAPVRKIGLEVETHPLVTHYSCLSSCARLWWRFSLIVPLRQRERGIGFGGAWPVPPAFPIHHDELSDAGPAQTRYRGRGGEW
jgi:hypothetical protein